MTARERYEAMLGLQKRNPPILSMEHNEFTESADGDKFMSEYQILVSDAKTKNASSPLKAGEAVLVQMECEDINNGRIGGVLHAIPDRPESYKILFSVGERVESATYGVVYLFRLEELIKT